MSYLTINVLLSISKPFMQNTAGCLNLILASILIFFCVAETNDKNPMGKTGEVSPSQMFPPRKWFPKRRTYKSERIIGGGIAFPHEYPFQAALYIFKQGQVDPNMCGGTLISNEWLLTAAHCLTMIHSMLVIVGVHDITTQEPSQLVLNASTFISHEDYDFNTVEDDIGLVRLSKNITFGNFINRIKLSGSSSTYSGVTATCLGWGMSREDQFSPELRYVNLQVIPNDLCKIYSSFRDYITDKHLCTSGKGFTGSCQGDSGGPLLADGKQIGIVSFGSKQCDLGVPSVFTRVSKYATWITHKTGIEIDNRGHVCQMGHFIKVYVGMVLNMVTLKCL